MSDAREDLAPALGGDRAGEPLQDQPIETAPPGAGDLEQQLGAWLDGTTRMLEERLPATADAIDGLFQAMQDALGAWLEGEWPR